MIDVRQGQCRLHTTPRCTALLIVLGAVGMWGLFVPATYAHNAWVYSWDSAAYIEAANSLLAGRGFMQRAIHGLGPDIWVPMQWWPPGYSILIAAGSLVGLPATTGCVAVSILGAMLSVVLLVFVFLRLFHWTLALPLIVAVVASTPFQKISTQCMSDTSYYFFAVASIACMVQWTARPNSSLLWMLGAGLFAGAAWATRNVGLALFAATGIFILTYFSVARLREFLNIALAWLIGMAIVGLPLLAHNVLTFGRPIPYEMPPSDLTLGHNVRRTVSIVVQDMTTFSWAGIKYLLAAAALAALALGVLRAIRSSTAEILAVLRQYRLPICLIAYIAFYIAIVIAARTKYRWGEEIDPRHMVQIYWVLWISLALGGIAFLEYCRVGNMHLRICMSVVLSVAAGLQVYNHYRNLTQPVLRVDTMEGRLGERACRFLENAVGQQQIVLSTRADLLRVHCNVNARKLPPVSQYDYLEPLTREAINAHGRAAFLWGLVIEDLGKARSGALGFLVKQIIERPEDFPELRQVAVEGPAMILRYVGK